MVGTTDASEDLRQRNDAGNIFLSPQTVFDTESDIRTMRVLSCRVWCIIRDHMLNGTSFFSSYSGDDVECRSGTDPTVR